MKKLWLLITLFGFIGITNAADMPPEKEIRQLIKKTVNAVLDVVKTKELPREEKIEKIMGVVDPVFDLRLMAKLTLGRKNWPKFTLEERHEFQDLFVRQMQVSYFDKVELFSDRKISYTDAVPTNKNKYKIETSVGADGNDAISLSYNIYKNKQKSWKVYDVDIEGISLVKSYGAQYDQVLQKGTPEDLLKKLREKISALSAPQK